METIRLEQVGMKLTEKWDMRFLELAKHIAQWSKDPSTKVGAVIVRPDKTIVSVGYNGFPRGVKDSQERYVDKVLKYSMVVHAEANAILNSRELLNGYTIYVWPTLDHPPTCNECAKVIIQAGIKTVVGYAYTDNPLRYSYGATVSYKMYNEAGVMVRLI